MCLHRKIFAFSIWPWWTQRASAVLSSWFLIRNLLRNPNRAGGVIGSQIPAWNVNPNCFLNHQMQYSNSHSSQCERVFHQHDEAWPGTINSFSHLCGGLSSKQQQISSERGQIQKGFPHSWTIHAPHSIKSSNGRCIVCTSKTIMDIKFNKANKGSFVDWLTAYRSTLKLMLGYKTTRVVSYLLKRHPNISHQDNVKDTLAEQLKCTKSHWMRLSHSTIVPKIITSNQWTVVMIPKHMYHHSKYTPQASAVSSIRKGFTPIPWVWRWVFSIMPFWKNCSLVYFTNPSIEVSISNFHSAVSLFWLVSKTTRNYSSTTTNTSAQLQQSLLQASTNTFLT